MSNLEPLVQFGPWYYRATVGKVWLATEDESFGVMLEPRLQKLLNYFLLHPHQLLSKDQLIADVWPAGEGTDGAVMRAIGALRKTLGDSSQAPTFINTIPKKGYYWLADVTPLTSGQALSVKDVDTSIHRIHEPKHHGSFYEWSKPKRFFSLAVLSLVLSCGIIAYGLTYLTLSTTQPVYTRIQPISALNGREQLPWFSQQHSILWYQHQAAEQQQWHWVRQSRDQSSVQHAMSSFNAMSSGIERGHDMVFSAVSSGYCGIYLQRMVPLMQPERQIGSCQQWLRHGMALQQDQLFWFDSEDGYHFHVWRSEVQSDTVQLQAERVLASPLRALQILRLLSWQDRLYALVQVSLFQTDLVRLRSDSEEWELVHSYPYVVTELTATHDQLWLGLPQQPFIGLKTSKALRQSLGSLSTGLTDLQLVDSEIIAVEGADAVSDFWTFSLEPWQPLPSMHHWFASNRSERLAAIKEHQIAFVSERSGSGQIWMAQREQLRQLTELSSEQQVQQLLWYRQHLLALINQQLFQVDSVTGALHSFLPFNSKPSRIEVCRQQLYWTEYGEDGWHLFTMGADRIELVRANVVDFRCAPGGFVLRTSEELAPILWADDRLQELALAPFSLALADSAMWLTNDQGIAWVDHASNSMHRWFWDGRKQKIPLNQAQQITALYSDKSGQFWLIEQKRQQDSDIVRLLPDAAR